MAQRKQLTQIIELGVEYRQMNTNIMHDAIVALAQERARARVAASAPAALTDNSGGTAAATKTLAAVPTPILGVVDTVTAFSPKTGFDAAIVTVLNAHGELIAKTNAFLTLIVGASGPTITPPAGAAAADGTVGAVTVALTAAATGCVPGAAGRAEIVKARNMQAQIASAINFARVAMGLDTLSDGSGGTFDRTYAGWDAEANGSAGSGTAVSTAGDVTLTDASVDAALVVLTNNIATMAGVLNQMRGTLAIGPFVVATSHARNRLRGADVTV